jgi:hypothetical protein
MLNMIAIHRHASNGLSLMYGSCHCATKYQSQSTQQAVFTHTCSTPQRGGMAKEDHAGYLTTTMQSSTHIVPYPHVSARTWERRPLAIGLRLSMILSASKKPHLRYTAALCLTLLRRGVHMIGMVCLFSALWLTHAAGAMRIIENVRKHMIRPTANLRKPANPEADFATSKEQQTGELTRASPSHKQGLQNPPGSSPTRFRTGRHRVVQCRHKSYRPAPTWSMIREMLNALRNGRASTDHTV